jgi:hypothetical protein
VNIGTNRMKSTLAVMQKVVTPVKTGVHGDAAI